jgi:hypothetical protein
MLIVSLAKNFSGLKTLANVLGAPDIDSETVRL